MVKFSAAILFLIYSFGCLAQEPQVVWDQTQFESEISAAVAECRPVKVPPMVELSRTIDLGKLSGLSFQGNSKITNYNAYKGNKNFPNAACRIIWVGPPDSPVFVTKGTGCKWEGITFVFPQPAIAAILVAKGDGIGTGKIVIENCSFLENPQNRHSTVAIQAATRIGEGNCDVIVIRDCYSSDMKNLFLGMNHMTLGDAAFSNITVRNKSAFCFKAGGKFSAFSHSSVGDSCVLELGEQGGNNNRFEIYGLSVDNQVPQDFVLIRSTMRRYIQDVTISGKLSGDAMRTREELLEFLGPTDVVDLSNLSGIK